MRAALHAEAVKLAASTLARVTTVALVAGIVVLAGSFLLALRGGNAMIAARLGEAATDDWAGLTSSSVQIASAGGLGAVAIVLAWMVGREFVEGTLSGLFALPVGRASIAGAKLAVFLLWGLLPAALVPAAVLATGLALGLGAPDADELAGLGRLALLGVANLLVALPIAGIATLTRSILGGVASAVGLVVIAQVSVVAGAGAWNPIALPALWAIAIVEPVPTARLLLLVPYAALSIALTLLAWRRLQVV